MIDNTVEAIRERRTRITPCRICGAAGDVHGGRCNRCHLYYYRNGRQERPVGNNRTCPNCSKPIVGRVNQEFRLALVPSGSTRNTRTALSRGRWSETLCGQVLS